MRSRVAPGPPPAASAASIPARSIATLGRAMSSRSPVVSTCAPGSSSITRTGPVSSTSATRARSADTQSDVDRVVPARAEHREARRDVLAARCRLSKASGISPRDRRVGSGGCGFPVCRMAVGHRADRASGGQPRARCRRRRGRDRRRSKGSCSAAPAERSAGRSARRGWRRGRSGRRGRQRQARRIVHIRANRRGKPTPM